MIYYIYFLLYTINEDLQEAKIDSLRRKLSKRDNAYIKHIN